MFNTLITIMAFQYLGTIYKWGGNDTRGMDCSGFVLKVLSDVGYDLPDMTANALYNYCINKNGQSSKECDSLIFFGRTNKITHVAISLGKVNGKWLMVEAAGAGRESLNMSKDDLLRIDARVRIKPVDHRSDLVASLLIDYNHEKY